MSRQLISAALIVFGTGTALISEASGQQAAAPRPQSVAVTARSVVRPPVPRLLAAARAVAPTMIQGNALSSTNGQMPNTVVRLRDARFGRIVGTEITDQSGLFAFRNVDPGTYIVEVMGSDSQTILAASQMLNVNAGEAVSAIVKLPFRIPPFAGLMGGESTVLAASQLLSVNAGEVASAIVKLPFRVTPFAGAMGVNSTPTASLLMAQAAANGVIAVASTTPVSPNQ